MQVPDAATVATSPYDPLSLFPELLKATAWGKPQHGLLPNLGLRAQRHRENSEVSLPRANSPWACMSKRPRADVRGHHRQIEQRDP